MNTTSASPPSPSAGVPALECRNLSRVYPLPGRRRQGVTAVSSVSLALAAGSFTSLVGASGCGKSTLLACLAGLDRPTQGTVSVLGRRTTGLSPRAAARLRAEHVGFVFQEDNLVTALSARENVALPGRLRRRPLSRAQVSEALARVGLSAQASQLPHELSGGERQRVAIARVLASRPAVVFADEPTAALDAGAAAAVLDWLAELTAAGTAVLMVTHDAAAAARAGRVLVMDAGHIIGQLPGGDPGAVSDAVLAARAGGGR
ncbi:ABC transporter ATP-binding protein [Actinomyces respiraculi]|uniref:ABC transporter ATP-binding protein n=1 Tax=Actinomyces respiraculi TaxID=2744574 RepID=UPI0018E0AF2B|nr:ABC transporter ATP-binding protein [Actinomyces respiraculi]